MWEQRIEENGDSEWRGSVHQVDSGTHVYIAGANEVADFINARLAGEGGPVRSSFEERGRTNDANG
jgi:hypothetical protein